ncbi:hypothetical protein KP509_1Z028500 [Ceratopteris richardii]|nr:hypothetical protein KP509_1Z028500 [Ceratopteris richardii]
MNLLPHFPELLRVSQLPPKSFSTTVSLRSLQPSIRSLPSDKQYFRCFLLSYSLAGKQASFFSYRKREFLAIHAGLVESGSLRDMAPSDREAAWMRILEDGVFRFDSSLQARLEAYPSLSFVEPRQREIPFEGVSDGNNIRNPMYYPSCRSDKGNQVTIFELPSGTSFYGTGEVSGPLNRTGQRIFTWNSDAWGYSSSTTSLYQSHPWVLAVLPDGEAIGFLADTTRRLISVKIQS